MVIANEGGFLEDLFLMSLASKPTRPRKCPVLGLRTALFFDLLKKKITQESLILTSVFSTMTFFLRWHKISFSKNTQFLHDDLSFFGDHLQSCVLDLGLERVCPRILEPWPRPCIFLSP